MAAGGGVAAGGVADLMEKQVAAARSAAASAARAAASARHSACFIISWCRDCIMGSVRHGEDESMLNTDFSHAAIWASLWEPPAAVGAAAAVEGCEAVLLSGTLSVGGDSRALSVLKTMNSSMHKHKLASAMSTYMDTINHGSRHFHGGHVREPSSGLRSIWTMLALGSAGIGGGFVSSVSD